jgi:hypothetical protein
LTTAIRPIHHKRMNPILQVIETNLKFGAADPEEAYGHLVPELVYANTADFRSYYEYRKVK